MNVQVPKEDLLAVVKLVGFLADLCTAQPEELNVALCRFTQTYYPAARLAAEAAEVGERLARLLGFTERSLEAAP